MMDSISAARLEQVFPRLGEKIRTLAEQLLLEDIEIHVTQGLRSWMEQDKLYAKGRTVKSDIACAHHGITIPVGHCLEHPLGAVVTNAPGGHSYHNFGAAVDVAPDFALGPPFTPDWNTSHPCWQRIIVLGKSLGLQEGALWRTFKDWPHLQLNGRFPEGAPNDEVRQLFKDGGMQAVWEEIGRS